MAESRLHQLSARGQSVWIDYLSRDLLESGELRPAIDRTYDLAEAQDALRTFGEGHVRGKLVLTI